MSNRMAAALASAAVLLSAGCGKQGLPEAGPKPGETDIGYGTQPTEKTTGAVSTVTSGNLAGAGGQTVRLDELLRGKVSGLQILRNPDGSYRFLIRGLSTGTTNPPEPLFVVDGTQVQAINVEGALAGLTRDDIKQVDVLKDVASTSIYGARGVGGVIIINTKRR